MDFNILCTNGKMNNYSILWFTYLVVPHRLWRHNCVTYQERIQNTENFGSVC